MRVTVTCEWRSTHTFDTEDHPEFEALADFDTLDDLPKSMLDEMDSHTAELVDWEVKIG